MKIFGLAQDVRLTSFGEMQEEGPSGPLLEREEFVLWLQTGTERELRAVPFGTLGYADD